MELHTFSSQFALPFDFCALVFVYLTEKIVVLDTFIHYVSPFYLLSSLSILLFVYFFKALSYPYLHPFQNEGLPFIVIGITTVIVNTITAYMNFLNQENSGWYIIGFIVHSSFAHGSLMLLCLLWLVIRKTKK